MRTVFFGTPEIAVPSLEALSRHHQIAAVVCQPDKPQGRSKKLVAPPVKVWAEAAGIPVHQPAKLNDGDFEAWLRQQEPEVCTVAAYGRLLKPPILAIPPQGWLNVHPSLLPRYRGASPIQSAILAGDTETGVTIMRVVEEMDAGDMVLQQRLEIGENETSAELSGRLAKLGAELLVEALDLMAAGALKEVPQDPALVTHCHLIEKEDGRIDWTRDARGIHNQIRACVPWPVAFTELNGLPLRVYRSRYSMETPNAEPGRVTAVEKASFSVATGGGILTLLEVQAPGKRVMSVEDFMRGHRIEPGLQLGAGS